MPIAHHPSPTVGPPLLWVALLALVAGGVLAWLRTRRPLRRGTGAPDRELLFTVAALTLGAGAVHVLGVPGHAEESVLFGIAFALFAGAQVLLGLRLLRRPSARLLGAVAGANAAIAGIWLLSRTVGLPVGPAPWTPEPIGPPDLVATFFELAAAVLGAALVSASPRWLRVEWRGVTERSQGMAVLVGAAAIGAVLGGG